MYEGQWKDKGTRHVVNILDYGTMTYKDGSVQKGTWKNGKFQEEDNWKTETIHEKIFFFVFFFVPNIFCVRYRKQIIVVKK